MKKKKKQNSTETLTWPAIQKLKVLSLHTTQQLKILNRSTPYSKMALIRYSFVFIHISPLMKQQRLICIKKEY